MHEPYRWVAGIPEGPSQLDLCVHMPVVSVNPIASINFKCRNMWMYMYISSRAVYDTAAVACSNCSSIAGSCRQRDARQYVPVSSHVMSSTLPWLYPPSIPTRDCKLHWHRRRSSLPPAPVRFNQGLTASPLRSTFRMYRLGVLHCIWMSLKFL